MNSSSPTTPGTVMKAPSTVENIQALRGFAAFLVLWAHLKFPMGDIIPGSENLFWVYPAHGAIGVDLFFIISGYVICLTACKRHHQPLDFFLARIARVSPLYYVAFIGALIIHHFSPVPPYAFHTLWVGLFYLPAPTVERFFQPPVNVGWTLSFEMWFYVVFTLLLFFWKPAKVAIVLPIFFFVGAGLMSFYHASWYLPKFLFHPFVLEFSMGCILYHLQGWLSGKLSWLLLIGGVAYMLAFSQHTGYLGYHMDLLNSRFDHAWLRVLLWGVPSALVAAGLLGLERCQGLILPAVLIWLGEISYSVYLSHEFTLKLIEKFGPKAGIHNPYVLAFVIMGMCIGFGWLCWKFIEKPLTTRAQKWVKKQVATKKPSEEKPVTLKPLADASTS